MVAMNVWPTDAADGAVSSEARWRSMGRLWAPSGVAARIGLEMAPSLAYPNLTVKNGACWVDGHYCELVGDQVLTVTANGLAVVRFDPAANTAELLYRDGITTPIQNPTGTWEHPIAKLTGSAMSDQRGTLIDPARPPMAITSAAAIYPWAAVPPLGARLIIQAGAFTDLTSAAGAITIPWPQPFPTGVVAFSAIPVGAAHYFSTNGRGAISKTGVQVIVFGAGGATVNNTSVDISFQAIGW